MYIHIVTLSLILKLILAKNCNIPGSDKRCENFKFDDKEYPKGECRYDYFHQKAWCATEVKNDLEPESWEWCPDNCDHDKIICSNDRFEHKSDNLWYRLTNNEKRLEDNQDECSKSNRGAIFAHADTEENLQAIKSHFRTDVEIDRIWIGLVKMEIESGFEANKAIWTKTGEQYSYGTIETLASGDKCVAFEQKRTSAGGSGPHVNIVGGQTGAAGQQAGAAGQQAAGSDSQEFEYKVVDVNCDDRYKILCQKECNENPSGK